VKAIWQWIKKHWKGLLGALAGIATVLLAGITVRAIRAAVVEHRGFKVVPNDPTSIDILDKSEFVRVKLPRDVTSGQVSVAGISSMGEWAVEIHHTPTDRHGDPAADDGGSLHI